MMHGMAGSAALIRLSLQTVPSFAMGLAYIALIGLGSLAALIVYRIRFVDGFFSLVGRPLSA